MKMSKKEEKNKTDVFESDEVETSKDSKEDKRENAELKVLREEVERLNKEKEELTTQKLMAIAESQNYKKRMDEEQAKFYKYHTFDICKQLISSLDNLDLALEREAKNEEMSAYLQGFKMVRNSLFQILEKEGVKEVESLGKEFDPNYMTSISIMNDPTHKNNEVVQVFQKAYMYKDRILRPAMVVVNQVEEEVVNEENNKEE